MSHSYGAGNFYFVHSVLSCLLVAFIEVDCFPLIR